MKTNSKILNMGFALAAAVAIISPQTSFAGRTIVPGTDCQVWGGHAGAASSIKYSTFGNVYNTNSNARVSVVCPVPRHNQGSSPVWVRVYYWDRNPVGGTNGQLGCRLRSNSAYGTQVVDTTAASTNASGGTYFGYWHFTGVTATNNQPNYPLNLTMQCFLPAAYGSNYSSIGSIVIDEPNSNTH